MSIKHFDLFETEYLVHKLFNLCQIFLYMNDYIKKILNVFLILVILAVLGYLFFFSPIREIVTLDSITSFVESFGMLGPIVFILIYIIGLLLLIPATLFTIAGGFLFGLFFGVVYVVIAATIAAVLGFLISRKFSSKWNFVTSNVLTQRIVSKCEGHCEDNGLQTFIILRLLYIPYMPLSYAAGLVKTAKLQDFTLATFLTNIVGSFSFAYFGSQLDAGLKGMIIPIVLIILTLCVPKIVKKFDKNNKFED